MSQSPMHLPDHSQLLPKKGKRQRALVEVNQKLRDELNRMAKHFHMTAHELTILAVTLGLNTLAPETKSPTRIGEAKFKDRIGWVIE